MSRLFPRSITVFVLLLIGIFMVVSVASADVVETIFITGEIETIDFPDVNLSFRAVDTDNNVPDILTNEDIVLYENGQPITNFEIGEPIDGPVTVIFVIDLGQAANLTGAMGDAVRDSMIHFTDGYFREEVDTVAVLARAENNGADETVVLLEPTQSASQFTSAVNTLNLLPTGRTEGLLGVDSALSRLSRLVEPGNAGTAIIYISRLVEWPQQSISARNAQSLAAAGREQFVKFYSFHTDSDFGEPLQTLAEQTGGEYLQLSADRDNDGNLNRIYQSIMAQGTTYTLDYRSQIGDSGPRTVAVAPSGTPAELALNAQTYNISLLEPIVKIEEPEDNIEYTRTATRTGEDSWNYDLDNISVTAELSSWPDSIERDIVQADFVVNGIVQHSVENPSGSTFRFNLDISNIEEPDSITAHVRIQDELGIEAESDSITINIAIVRDKEVIVLPAGTPPPVPTPIVINEDPCVKNPGSTECVSNRILTYAPWGIVIILSIIVLVYRQNVVAVAGAAGGALRERVAIVRETILGGGGVRNKKVLAKIHVIVARRDLEGERVKIHTNRTTIGRNPKLCDVLLYDEDEVSSVSGQHCTIQYDRGTFLLTDDNSANGTTVNGELLPANNPRELKHGDEIVLGNLFHRGAKLRFEANEAISKKDLVDDNNNTIIDSEFVAPSIPNIGSETILDLEDDALGTLTEELPDNIETNPKKKKDDDWLNDLE